MITARKVDHLQLGRRKNFNLPRPLRAYQHKRGTVRQHHVVRPVRKPHLVRQETLHLWAARKTEPQIGPSIQSTVINLKLLQLRQRQVQNQLVVARAHRVGDLHALENGHVRGGEGDGAETHAVEAQTLELGHVAGATEVEHGARPDVVGGDGERADSGVALRDEVDELLLRRGERGGPDGVAGAVEEEAEIHGGGGGGRR
ncbi:hypothetical protein FGB62_196g03 [Gracilaria domingensis]|nr:hypothetical protein FGB62_196g03 [Gracilaria domingensis]